MLLSGSAVGYSPAHRRREPPIKQRDTRQRKQALAGLKATAGIDWMLGTLVRVIHSGKQALDAVMLGMNS